ncbi:hypothetical protein [Sulfitobacter sp. S190]|uniref:hypothetical protein n=1 Tax=Sulfitobacter sp. S190 TaxID=2867022 RepID=UPI0021A8DD09|nr:hypothetical protein [Sulfitobacter sp. S190]UWR23793.1 hypothetical protein K3756_07485 [Sulfitobacter sp. S190]
MRPDDPIREPADDPSNNPRFLELQFEAGNQRIMAAVRKLDLIEYAVIIGIAAVYAFAFTAPKTTGVSIYRFALFLPVGLSLFAAQRTHMQILYIHACAAYVRQVEHKLSAHFAAFGQPLHHQGWEEWYATQTHVQAAHRRYRFILWFGMLALTTVVALTFGCATPACNVTEWLDVIPNRAVTTPD